MLLVVTYKPIEGDDLDQFILGEYVKKIKNISRVSLHYLINALVAKGDMLPYDALDDH